MGTHAKVSNLDQNKLPIKKRLKFKIRNIKQNEEPTRGKKVKDIQGIRTKIEQLFQITELAKIQIKNAEKKHHEHVTELAKNKIELAKQIYRKKKTQYEMT